MAKKKKRQRDDLRRLANQPLTDEEASAALRALYETAHPIVTAILGQAQIEYELELLLSTFNAKIIAAHAFGLIDDLTLQNLKIVKDIRNHFAHSKRLISFKNKAIVSALESVSIPPGRGRRSKGLKEVALHAKGGRQAFLGLCSELLLELLRHSTRLSKARSRRLERSFKRMAQELAGLGSPFGPLNALAGYATSFQGHKTGGPPIQGLLADAFPSQHQAITTNDKKDQQRK
jgi:hypothetical protein